MHVKVGAIEVMAITNPPRGREGVQLAYISTHCVRRSIGIVKIDIHWADEEPFSQPLTAQKDFYSEKLKRIEIG